LLYNIIIMCKNWFHKPPIVPITGDKVALLFGINDYMGNSNDLSGCLNDIDDVEKKLNKEFPGFQIKKFKDSEVTTQRFISEIENALMSTAKFIYIHYSGHGTQIPSSSEPNGYNEALYLYNGPLIDDKIYELQQKTPDNKKVTAKFDSCFSGDLGSRLISDFAKWDKLVKNRFFQMPGVPLLRKPVNRLANTDINQKWIIISGCGEEQTSADAWFGGRANGAFTYYDNKSYAPDSTYSYEVIDVNDNLALNGFDQRPELSGPANRINGIVLT
jgi:metacaspase-1